MSSFNLPQNLKIAWGCFADEEKAITDSLTVEFSRVPGKTFHRKVLSKFRSIYFCKLVLVPYHAFNLLGLPRCNLIVASFCGDTAHAKFPTFDEAEFPEGGQDGPFYIKPHIANAKRNGFQAHCVSTVEPRRHSGYRSQRHGC